MVHYVPASLENITQVVAYVMNKENGDEMKSIVKSANSWCKGALSEEGLANGAIRQLEVYRKALDEYGGWREEWRGVKQCFDNTIGVIWWSAILGIIWICLSPFGLRC